MKRTLLIATWCDGVYVLGPGGGRHELAGRSVRGLAPDNLGGTMAVVDAHQLRRRTQDGAWSTIATLDAALACCVAVGEGCYVGTDDARIWRIDGRGAAEPLPGFDACPGRDSWYAGQARVNGRMVGPPLGVRSLAATVDGALLANVHVGGIARSADGGDTWTPTIDIDCDVHEVRAHPTRPEMAVAAAAVGLCTSSDGGATWVVETAGLHAVYCSSVGFLGEQVLVAASTGHFDAAGAVYQRGVRSTAPLAEIGRGFPQRIAGIADTGCIAVRGETVAIAARMGAVHVSTDGGRAWSLAAGDLPTPSCALVV